MRGCTLPFTCDSLNRLQHSNDPELDKQKKIEWLKKKKKKLVVMIEIHCILVIITLINKLL